MTMTREEYLAMTSEEMQRDWQESERTLLALACIDGHGDVRIDSRMLFGRCALACIEKLPDGSIGMSEMWIRSKKSYEAWMNFIHEYTGDFETLGEIELRRNSYGTEFALLTGEQACILVLFDRFDLTAFRRCQRAFHQLKSADFLYVRKRFKGLFFLDCHRTWVDALSDLQGQPKQPHEKTLKPEKRIEVALGKLLEEQGEEVRYQVPCENGVADIVTPNAIYEIKAHLSKSNLHEAIGQVLGYRACLNPTARAVIVGRQFKKNEPVAIKFAQSVGVEVLVWPEDEAQWKAVLEQIQKRQALLLSAPPDEQKAG